MYISEVAAVVIEGTELPVVSSVYVAMSDGVRVAVDLWSCDDAVQRPAIVLFTRYWRSWRSFTADPLVEEPTGDAIKYFTKRGYAFVVVDVRGTGASFGHRQAEWSPQEVQDHGEVIEWIAQQPWSNGAVATMGTSYPGNAAELAALKATPALRALVPRFTDFSVYRDVFRPGGVANRVTGETWLLLLETLDSNNAVPRTEVAAWLPPDLSVRPVDEDDDGTLLAEAVRQHAGSGDTRSIMKQLVFADDAFSEEDDTITLESISPSRLWRDIDARTIPSMHWASWFDAGTAEGVLTRYLNYQSPIRVIIGAWNHGATTNANPYGNCGGAPAEPPPADQFAAIDAFLRPLMGDSPGQAEPRLIEYFTLGADQWRTTSVWPPEGSALSALYLGEGGSLSLAAPPLAPASDVYVVDPAASTGRRNRWHTQLWGPVDYGDRRERDTHLLTYDTAPLVQAVELTGSPIAHLYIGVDDTDLTLFIYLEDVAPDGAVTLLSDAPLRLSLRNSRRDDAKSLGPVPTFSRTSHQALRPGERTLATLTLSPISVVVGEGHRLRLAIAGADADTFDPIDTGKVGQRHLTLDRSDKRPSHLLIPVVGRDQSEATL